MKKHKIIVSEPWHFIAPDGTNEITGKIVKIVSPLSIIFKADYFVIFGEVSGRMLILNPRYENQVLNEANGYQGTVGGGLLIIDDYEGRDEKNLELNSKYVLIGSLKEV